MSHFFWLSLINVSITNLEGFNHWMTKNLRKVNSRTKNRLGKRLETFFLEWFFMDAAKKYFSNLKNWILLQFYISWILLKNLIRLPNNKLEI